MENSVMGGGLLSGPPARLLGLEPSIHRHPLHHHFAHGPPLTLPHHNHHQMQAMGMMAGFSSDQSMAARKGIPVNYSKGKGISSATITATMNAAADNNSNSNNNTSDDDEPSFTEDGNDAHFNGAKGKLVSPWQRMKWTDDMVRLLVAVVSCVGEDGPPDNATEGLKRKSGASQKKGKWKMVSKIMMERGCYVSPQQCEDKFNDLNKRYKRLNDILGRGTTCQVVENPILLDSMTHLSPKMKDDVRKILSSKHLFYKEMCAYHNGQKIPGYNEIDLRVYCPPGARCSKDSNGFEGEDDEDNEDSDDDAENEGDANGDEDIERITDFRKRKKMNEEDIWLHSGTLDNFGAEMVGMLQDTANSPWEQPEWIRNRTLQLQEQSVSFQAQAFELEKSRFRWLRFCSKKDRELERLRLENERMRLENERMALQVKQRELEIDFKRSEASTNPLTIRMDRLPGRDQIDRGRVQ
ncbi:uncharacterized protein LOC131222502 [Magnolia sinica]|uniref:uncharacterized protein LOC131222502 n=1 Tax=Magnolia sinica TaxID=86752 RepID=UPI002658677C|nr:uncharacterized protein LOC131222502 [Magnolia sinica]XP_058073571.1 uncharacterized protein LOC131222502 [Magnolia sinica]XP_058073572.1 uncharacterized protein LOC131222502 [Magnolia sinica]